jgi:hypothetical protein
MNIIGGKLDGEYVYDNGYTLRYRKLNDEEIKFLFHNIQLNTSFCLPERLVQDYVQDGSIVPTFKKCTFFNKEDLNEMIRPFKKNKPKRKNLPKKKTRKNKKVESMKHKGKERHGKEQHKARHTKDKVKTKRAQE